MLQSDLHIAESELIRFIRKEWAEAKKLGYPTMSAFAKDIARGTLSPAAQEQEDPVQDRVAKFYHGLREYERRAVSEKFLFMYPERQRAANVGVGERRLRRIIKRVILRLATHLRA